MELANFPFEDIPFGLCLIALLLYAYNYKALQNIERLILAIIAFNFIVDLTGHIFSHFNISNHFLYNVLIPVERSLSLFIYARNEKAKEKLITYEVGIAVILAITIIGFAMHGGSSDLHFISNILSGLLLALFSYLHLRSIALDSAKQSLITFFFTLANLVYFTLMVSAMSAFPLALQIGNEFGRDIYNINLFAYALWSIILITGILWKKPKT